MPEPEIAVAEIARVVTPDGTVAIMTNGPAHLAEIMALRVDVLGPSARYAVNEAFSPRDAASVLVNHFDQVAWRRDDDTLAVTDFDDLIAFITSTPPSPSTVQLAELRARIEQTMASNDGVFRVSKDTGAFICRSPRDENADQNNG